MSLMVCPSTPAAPTFALTSRHARRKMSSRYTLSKSAWNRRVALTFAARYSARWSCRVLSLMWLAVTAFTHAYPRLTRRPSTAPSLHGITPLLRYYGPFRLPLRTRPLRRVLRL